MKIIKEKLKKINDQLDTILFGKNSDQYNFVS